MSSEEAPGSSESDVTSMSYEDTELTLGLPGEGRSSAVIPALKCSAKRGFIETFDLNLGRCCNTSWGHRHSDKHVNESGAGKPPATKAQAVGWPPVRSYRQKAINESSKLYVKVAVDGAPYLRKVNLEHYSNYQDLMKDLDNLFTCFTIRNSNMEESKLMDVAKGMEHVPTYEDKDGDWMLVGDVPLEDVHRMLQAYPLDEKLRGCSPSLSTKSFYSKVPKPTLRVRKLNQTMFL